MRLTIIEDPDDPRIADYRDIRERDLVGRRGLLVAEGAVVLRVLLSEASRARPRSVLLARNRVEAFRDVLEPINPSAPVYVAAQPVLDAIAGFPLHRGVLALAETPTPPDLDNLLAGAPDDAVVVVALGIGNHDNMGGILRNAAAFGAHAVLLDDRCCDPFYRKAIRVSVGASLRVPIGGGRSAVEIVERLQAHGFGLLALTPAAHRTLASVRRHGRTALLLGSEGPGLSPEIIARAQSVGIPMAGGFDSLNVAATSAIALHQLMFGSGEG